MYPARLRWENPKFAVAYACVYAPFQPGASTGKITNFLGVNPELKPDRPVYLL
jgi:hypothetical protein